MAVWGEALAEMGEALGLSFRFEMGQAQRAPACVFLA